MDAEAILRNCTELIGEGAGEDFLQWAHMVQDSSRIHAAIHDPTNLTRSATKAAELLGTTRETLHRKMSNLGGGIRTFQAASTWQVAGQNLSNFSLQQNKVKERFTEMRLSAPQETRG